MVRRPEARKAEAYAVFVSDLHMGFRHSRLTECRELLSKVRPRFLYLVGDILDGWRLSRRWYWDEDCSRILESIHRLVNRGTKVVYLPGNHDSFVLNCPMLPAGIEFEPTYEHQSLACGKFLVTHGDQFDTVESKARWLSMLGCTVYDGLLQTNQLSNRACSMLGVRQFQWCAGIKRMTKRVVQRISNYSQRLTEAALTAGCQGVICGHSHTPTMKQNNEVAYFNTGDWVENQSAIIEFSDGDWELRNFGRLAGYWRDLDSRSHGAEQAVLDTSAKTLIHDGSEVCDA